MNKIVNKFLLAGNKFMSEMHLRQVLVNQVAVGKPVFRYSACGSFTKNKEKTQKFKETVDT